MSLKASQGQPIERRPPLVRADALSSVVFERRDVPRMIAFLEDFGLKSITSPVGNRRFLRGYGNAPYCVELIPSDRDAFVGLTLMVRSAVDLDVLAARHGASVEAADGPGGGSRVRLKDPDGWRVDVVHGAQPVAPITPPATSAPQNTPCSAKRINSPIRNPVAPSPVMRMGHVVLHAPDFARTSAWYMEQFGFIPSDVQVTADGNPALGFFRLDRGEEPADHHTLAILAGPAPALLHVSTETPDLEAIGQGQQHLLDRGWTHYWGIGRHVLGSQIFDYWKDPAGDEWEHYADGDLLTADYPTGYSELNRGGLWAWGDDLPESMRPPEDIPEQAPPPVKALLQALLVPPRSWLR